MLKSLADVLALEDDSDLCIGLYSLLIARYGKNFDPAVIPVEHRTAFLVWQTNTMIGNGGFNGFFKSELPVDPQYVHMQAAYEAVGCEPAATALRRVFDVFTNRIPPADPAERLKAFLRGNNALHGALNRDFLKANTELTTALAAYIRGHAAAFADVERPPAPYSLSAAPEEEAPEVLTEVVDIKVQKLPRWARAAFFANCARLVSSLWDDAWPEAPHNYREAVDQAIILAEMCAAQGQSIGDLRAASELAVQAAHAAVATDPTARLGGAAPADAAVAVSIAIAAACALDFISGEQNTNAYEFAKVAVDASGSDALEAQVDDHYRRIAQLAREEGWNDRTPVPPEVFRADFEGRGKSWWKRW